MAENENPATPIAENTPTQTLFRFVSLRSPQLSDEKDQDKRFVLMPEDVKTDGHFYGPVTSGTSSKKELLLAQASSYATSSDCISKESLTHNTLENFKRSYKAIYDFSVWVARNKSTCTYSEFNAQTAALLLQYYPVPEMTTLWDNFIYQVVTQKDFYIKEVMMQMILALHTLQLINNEEETKVLLAARVVLPKEMMVDDTSNIINTSRIAGSEVKETFPSEEMKQQQQVSSAKTKLRRIESLKKNLTSTEKQYNKEYQAEYKVQEVAHQDRIAPTIAAYNEAVVAAKEEYCGMRPPGTEYNPEDPCQHPKEVPYPKLPPFEFNFRDQVTAESFTESLQEESLETLFDVLGYKFEPQQTNDSRSAEDNINDLELLLDGRDTFTEITSVINETVERLNNIILENTQSNEEVYTSIGGVIVPTARTISVPFTYQVCPKFLYKEYVNDLALTVPDASWDVSYISYNLTPNGSTTSIDGDYYVKSRTGNTIFLNDMHSPGVDFYSIQDAALRVKIIFSNGKATEIFMPKIQARACSSGNFFLEVEEGEPPVIIEDEDNFIPSGFGFKNIGVADYLKVEQSTHAYVEGEVANIENVMAREYREKSTRRLRRSENTTTSSTDTEKEQLTDTTTANRFEMQNEISKIMQEASDNSTQFGVSAGYSGGGFNINTNLGLSNAHHNSKEESTRQAMTQAQDVTSRAMDRIVTKVHEERIEKIIDEFEENNSHGLDNRKGDKHVVGVYRWVDKLMKNQIYNYGKRMMFEFIIPEPAKLHLLGMALNKNASELIKPEDPRKSTSMQMQDFTALNDENVLKYWISKYNVEIATPLNKIVLSKSFSEANIGANEVFSKNEAIEIPEGYIATDAYVNGYTKYDSDSSQYHSFAVTVGKKIISISERRQDCYINDNWIPLSNITKSISVSYHSTNYHALSVGVDVHCFMSDEYKKQFQQKTFKAIIDAYEEAVVDYNNKLAEEQSKAVEIKDSNPNFYRQIENTVLRKNCISYMADRAVGSTHGYGLSGLIQGSTFTDYETTLSSKLDKYTAFVKFMEQAFEWENLSYYLYPYYWGNKQNWVELYQSENTDPLFRAFLQSGMARVVATVRPGFEDVVQFYLSTGKIWNGGEVPVIGDELYLSIVDEMKEPKGEKQGKAWLTRLPTTLNILQAESIGLKVAHALPFTTENPDDFEVPSEVITEEKFNFETNENLLGIQPGDEEKIITGDWL
ncbi:nitrogen regulatory protein PII-like uncharacterized protein [Chryseobacterium ginsenosidimutans]|uniref:hypothetical protein n=1 Tax=Chryseobacterium ginsenosidimutans TaxID=687846 RepID=UPI002169714E|nr:hypothetical protein [Chryseobacterium ginsenosidimutans]MCS3867719.1 nitrogen regulatory protein PII-like uncharacterized protein [Chryseobacterium ginsenosidimutans]